MAGEIQVHNIMVRIENLQYSVVFALLSTGFAELLSYGPLIFLERAMVTICSSPVPPVNLEAE